MKINKFNESAETDLIKNEIKISFSNIWKDKLDLDHVGVTVYYPLKKAVYSILITSKKFINNETYEDFYDLFTFLKNSNSTFEFRPTSQLIVEVRDIDTFLMNLREKNDIKNYNL